MLANQHFYAYGQITSIAALYSTIAVLNLICGTNNFNQLWKSYLLFATGLKLGHMCIFTHLLYDKYIKCERIELNVLYISRYLHAPWS